VQRIILLIALAIGILVDGFFAFVNFYPVAPKPKKTPTRFVVAQLDETQAAWFQKMILDEFNYENNTDIRLWRVDDEEQLLPAVQAASSQGDVLLVGIPHDQTDAAINQGLVHAVTDVVPAATIATDFAPVRIKAMTAGQVNGDQYFLPDFSVVDIAIYRLSKVRDAVQNWTVLRPQIEGSLKSVNGYGLPDNYELELQPDKWDSYDLFVLAYYWRHRAYGSDPAQPRIAHRTGNQIDGENDITAGIYRFDEQAIDPAYKDTWDGSEIALRPPSSAPSSAPAGGATPPPYDATIAAEDYFRWEALYRRTDVYDRAMYASPQRPDPSQDPDGYADYQFDMSQNDGYAPYDDEATISHLQDGSLYFGTVDSMEAFTLHGGSFCQADSEVDDASDLGFAPIPSGSSLDMDKNGQPLRVAAATFAYREDWEWAFPAASKDGFTAYNLVKFMLGPDIHTAQCEAMGTLPLRYDVIDSRASRFRLPWMASIFDAALEEWDTTRRMPNILFAGAYYGSVYAHMWNGLIASEGYKKAVDPQQAVSEALHYPPAGQPLAAETLGPASEPVVTGPEPDGGLCNATQLDQVVQVKTTDINADDWRGTVRLGGFDGGTGDGGTTQVSNGGQL
jgi:maltose-binding protein MalE